MMSSHRPRLHHVAGLVSIAALIAAAMLPDAPARAVGGVAGSCAAVTTQSSLRPNDDDTLRCAPGQPLVVRDDLARPNATRQAIRDAVGAFLAIGDLHVVDEESPLRREWADSCADDALHGSFRPQETMIPHLVNAHIKALSALASDPTGTPSLHSRYAFAVQLGDATDNQQYNELRTAIDLLDGGRLVNPDSGGDGYQGAQASDPTGGSTALRSPVSGTSLRDLANEPFYAAGLRAGAAPLPWYAVIGSHDVKVQGSIPNDDGWRRFADAYARGSLKVFDLPPDQKRRVCNDPSVTADPSFWTSVATSARVVAPDERRRLVSRETWIAEHLETRGLPDGHGFARGRCTDADGRILERACYSWNHSGIHFVALDTAPDEGASAGNIDEEQFAWLERDLRANSSRYYTAGGDRRTTKNADRLIVVLSNHTTETMDNDAAPPGETVHDGRDLERLLLRFPNVVLHVDGHTHTQQAIPHRDRDKKTAYWEVGTAAVADWPTQSRSIEIADNHDGTLSIVALTVDGAAPANARTTAWAADGSNERALGAKRSINEDWIASAAREIAFNDPQVDHDASVVGSADDRNVELLLPHPFGVTAPSQGRSPSGGVPGPGFPHGGNGGFNFGPGFPPQGFNPGAYPFAPGQQPGFQFPRSGGFPGGGGFPQQGAFPGTAPFGPSDLAGGMTTTGAGLPLRPGEGASPLLAMRAQLLLLAAIAGAWWLFQARVRRWMIGI